MNTYPSHSSESINPLDVLLAVLSHVLSMQISLYLLRVLCSQIFVPVSNIGLSPPWLGAKFFAKFKPLKQLFRCFLVNFFTIYSRLNTNSPVLFI